MCFNRLKQIYKIILIPKSKKKKKSHDGLESQLVKYQTFIYICARMKMRIRKWRRMNGPFTCRAEADLKVSIWAKEGMM